MLIMSTVRDQDEGEPSVDEVAEEVEIAEATEEVAEIWEEVRPTCEEVASGKGVAKMDDEAEEVQPQVAEPGMEVAKGYNRIAQDIELYDQKESVQVPMKIDSVRDQKIAIADEIANMEKRMMDLVRVAPSSLPEKEKSLVRLRLFKEEIKELKDRASKKIEEKKKV